VITKSTTRYKLIKSKPANIVYLFAGLSINFFALSYRACIQLKAGPPAPAQTSIEFMDSEPMFYSCSRQAGWGGLCTYLAHPAGECKGVIGSAMIWRKPARRLARKEGE
jgi:hypothetical protein